MCKIDKTETKDTNGINECDKKRIPNAKNSKNDRPKQRKQPVMNRSKSVLNKNKPSILFDTILNDTRESKQQIMNRVDVWIHRWSYRRSFRQILNSVLDYKASDRRYINRGRSGDQNYSLMMKGYKKAIL